MVKKILEGLLLIVAVGHANIQSSEMQSNEDLRTSQVASRCWPCLEDEVAKPLAFYHVNASEEKMELYKALMRKEQILNFVSHPKTLEYFLQECEKFEEYIRVLYPEVLSLLEKYPEDKDILWDLSWLERDFFSLNFPLTSREVVVPFLKWGVIDTRGIENEQLVSNIKEFQIRLFKNFLAQAGIGRYDMSLESDLIAFCKGNPLPIFSSVIGPFLSWELELEDEDGEIEVIRPYRQILFAYSNNDSTEFLSYDQESELEYIFNNLPVVEGTSSFPWQLIYESLSADYDFDLTPPPLLDKEEEPTQAVLALEELCAKIPLLEDGFSREKIFKLFFEVVGEPYPKN